MPLYDMYSDSTCFFMFLPWPLGGRQVLLYPFDT